MEDSKWKEIMADIIKSNLAPMLFICIAGGLCALLPAENASEAIYLVIGAALTRVKRTDK